MPEIIADQRMDTIIELFYAFKYEKTLVIDFSRTRFVSPAGYAILACLYDRVVEQKTKIKIRKIKRVIKKLPIVEKIIHHAQVDTLSQTETLDYESDTLIFTCNSQALNPLFPEKLVNKFNNILNDDVRFDIQLIMNELMQNTVDHSSAERYYMYGGLWNNELHCGVLDMGVTIPAKLEQKYVAQNDIEYLERALAKGISTRRVREGGFGLYYFYSFLKKNNAKLTIISRNAQMRLYFKTRKSQKSLLKYPLNGTWCFARFDLENQKINEIFL